MKMIKIVTACLLVFSASSLHAEDSEKTLFRILGYVSEYVSRFDCYSGKPVENHVESFYPHETKVADDFENALKAYAACVGHPYSVKRTIRESGHMDFEDSWFSTEINKYYVKHTKPEASNLYTINRQFILDGKPESIMEYVASCYSRYGVGKKNSIYFANSPEKALTVAEALLKLGSTNVTIYKSREELVPTGYRLDFDPTPDQRSIFHMTEERTGKDKNFLPWKDFNTTNKTIESITKSMRNGTPRQGRQP